MSTERQPDPNDPSTWPIIECETADVFIDTPARNSALDLTDEQKAWPVVECESADVFIEVGNQAPFRSPLQPSQRPEA